MGQSRNKTGVKFEKEVCEIKGWTRKPVSPRLSWTGKGRSQFLQSKSLDFNPEVFKPIIESCRLVKYDAINENGEFVEIKDYPMKMISKWTLYSEFFSVKIKRQLAQAKSIFGDTKTYNNFISSLVPHFTGELINKLTTSNIGIQFRDGFIGNDDLEFRVTIVKNCYKGYDRITIQFKSK